MEESLQKEGNQYGIKLGAHSLDELESLKGAYPYSAHVHWELIRNKLMSGVLTNEDLQEASLHMKDAKAFFREVERLRYESRTNRFIEKKQPDGHQPIHAFTPPEKKVDAPQSDLIQSESALEEAQPEIEVGEIATFEEVDEKITSRDTGSQRDPKIRIPSGVNEVKSAEEPIENTEVEHPHSSGQKNVDTGEEGENFQSPKIFLLKPSKEFLSDQKGEALSGFTSWLKSLDQKPSGSRSEKPADRIGETDISEDKPGPELPIKKKVGKTAEEKKEGKKRSGKKTKKEKKKPKPAQDLELRPDVISETLADLLSNQGHFDEANEMYRRLGLKYPEKSSYFASKIKNS